MAIYTTQAAHLHRVEFPDSSVNDALEKWWGGIFTSALANNGRVAGTLNNQF